MSKSLLKQNDEFVPIEDIVSLFVTITQIVLVPTSELGGKGDKQDVPASHVLVFEGVLDVNLNELIGVSEVLSSAEIPADTYGEIRLSISYPRLVLTSEPEMEFTNIQLTANGRLFVQETFEILEGQDTLLLIDFGGVNVVVTGGAFTGETDFVLKEFLDVSLDVVDASVMALGTITGLDTAGDSFVLDIADSDSELTVNYGGAEILLPGGSTGSEEDLDVGTLVDVGGTISVNGTLGADTVQIL